MMTTPTTHPPASTVGETDKNTLVPLIHGIIRIIKFLILKFDNQPDLKFHEIQFYLITRLTLKEDELDTGAWKGHCFQNGAWYRTQILLMNEWKTGTNKMSFFNETMQMRERPCPVII